MKNALLHDGLRFWAVEQPDRIALTLDDDQELSYGALHRWSGGAAAHLTAIGVRPGDPVGIIGANAVEWVVWAFAVLRAGGVIVPFNERFVAGELAYLIETVEPRAIIADAPRLEVISPVIGNATPVAMESAPSFRDGPPTGWVEPRVASDSLAQIIFTSGTTGRPKGVMISHERLLSKYFEMRLMVPEFGGPDLRPLMMVSLHSGLGTTWGYLFATTNGGTFSFMRRFDPALALRILVERKITNLSSFPLMLEQIAHVTGFAEADLSSIDMAITGGTRVPASVLTTWREKGVLLRQMYGLTEVGNYATIGSALEVRENRRSCGRQMIFTQLRIVRPDGTECDVDEAGEIRAKGPGMMVGYWKNPEATAAAFEDGWLKTGDRGSLDADGYLTFVDREKDMIITGGFNVSPSEIEFVISEFGGIDEVAVIPVPDPRFGETPAACIHAAVPVDADALFAHCKAQLAGFKLPRYIIASDEKLPRNANAKIDKKLLTARYADAPSRYPKLG